MHLNNSIHSIVPHQQFTPPADLEIDLGLVQQLLADQQPDLADLPLSYFDSGWDNALFRLGIDLAVRLPRRAIAEPLMLNEQTWLPQLAPQLPLPISAPLRCGVPTAYYAWHWSVIAWIEGTTIEHATPNPDQAAIFGTFLRSLHRPAPANAPQNPYRGCPLATRAQGIEQRMAQLATKTTLITPKIRQLWDSALQAPVDVAATWLHGDLHPRNILLHNGAISGIIDWGDLTAGDCATDLAAIWMLFATPQAHQSALRAYGNPSLATIQRALGWAVLFGVLLLDTGLVDHPVHALIGERILQILDKSAF